jgi:hypothetical protein
VARVDDRPGRDVRPVFDQLAAGCWTCRARRASCGSGVARSTTMSLEAYRAYLTGVEQLNRWDLGGAQRDLQRAHARSIPPFGLAYYKLALTRGWLAGVGDSIATPPSCGPPRSRATCRSHERT